MPIRLNADGTLPHTITQTEAVADLELGGGVTVDNQSDPPAEVTTIVAPGASIAGDEADLSDVVSIRKAVVELTDAQIKALPTTPVEIVPSPGAGKVLLFIRGLVIVDATAADYTNIDADGSYLTIGYTGGGENTTYVINDAGASLTQLSALLTGNVRAVSILPLFNFLDGWGPTNNSVPTEANLEAANIEVFAVNGGNFTGGNAANSMKCIVLYTVVDV